MIQYQGGVPFICGDDGFLASFSQQWLQAILQQAARHASCETHWLLDDIASAVMVYLSDHHTGRIIRLHDLETKIKDTLNCIGYGELANSFRATPPHQRASLLGDVQGIPARSEAELFTCIRLVIADLNHRGAQRVHLYDLGACEREIRAANGWFSWCQQCGTRQKIVRFVRRQLSEFVWSCRFQCSIT